MYMAYAFSINFGHKKIIWRCNAKYKGTQQNEKFCWEKERLCSDQNFADKQNQTAKDGGTRQCNNKFKNKQKCKTPHLTENQIKEEFVKEFNNLIINKEEIIKDAEDTIWRLTDKTDLDAQVSNSKKEIDISVGLMRSLVHQNSRKAINQDEYNRKYDAYFDEVISEFDERFWNTMVEKLIINEDDTKEFIFKN